VKKRRAEQGRSRGGRGLWVTRLYVKMGQKCGTERTEKKKVFDILKRDSTK
jgi:hypothetical protein